MQSDILRVLEKGWSFKTSKKLFLGLPRALFTLKRGCLSNLKEINSWLRLTFLNLSKINDFVTSTFKFIIKFNSTYHSIHYNSNHWHRKKTIYTTSIWLELQFYIFSTKPFSFVSRTIIFGIYICTLTFENFLHKNIIIVNNWIQNF